MQTPSRRCRPSTSNAHIAPRFWALLLICLVAMPLFPLAPSAHAQTSPPEAAANPSLETVLAIVSACPRQDAPPQQCANLAGVTLGIEVDGAELAEGAVTTTPSELGFNVAPFQAPSDAFLDVAVLAGVPNGYVFADGTFRSAVSDLSVGGCGGEAICPYFILALVPDPSAPVPDPDRAPTIESAVSFAFAADDWRGAFAAIDAAVYQRNAVALYGAASGYSRATLTFDLDAAETGQTALTLTGLDDELPGSAEIVISVNGEIVDEGETAFTDWDPAAGEVAWHRWTLFFPSDLLQAGENTITVENLAVSANVGTPPYLLLSEAFVNVDIGDLG